MKKSILIALCLAGCGLLVGCVLPDALNTTAAQPKTATNHK